jgi:beta-mannosidase
LLQQDFPLAGGYSTEAAFYAEATRQAAAMVGQLGHHPSIALWCYHTDPAERDAELDRRVQATIRRLDATRPCVRGGVFV